jgi:hypothetical protein
MVDFVVNETTVKNIAPLSKNITLAAGEKIADDADILAFAQKIVPTGYEADVIVRIVVSEIRTV